MCNEFQYFVKIQESETKVVTQSIACYMVVLIFWEVGWAGPKRFGECYWCLLIPVPKCLYHYRQLDFLYPCSVHYLHMCSWCQYLKAEPDHKGGAPTTWLWCTVIFLPPLIILISIYHSPSSSIIIIIIDFALYSIVTSNVILKILQYIYIPTRYTM